MMSAWILDGPGGTDQFRRVDRPLPEVRPGWVSIAIAAIGINRSELFSRRGLSSDDFSFPRVLGLECVGHVLDPGGSTLRTGERVLALMGGMGRSFDGSYATHTVVPESQVFQVSSEAPDAVLGAIPLTYNTAWGMVIDTLQVSDGDKLLIRGGTSALGIAACELARAHGASLIVGTTRSRGKRARLLELGLYDAVVLDGEDLPTRVLDSVGPLTAAVECVGSRSSIESTCACMPLGGRVALGGQLAESWADEGRPIVPLNVRSGFVRSDRVRAPTDDARLVAIVDGVDQRRWGRHIDTVFTLDELPRAHERMERNEAVGKLVVDV